MTRNRVSNPVLDEDIGPHLDPSDIFSMMIISSIFEPRSASIEKKRLIFEKFWAADAPDLMAKFNSAGRGRLREEDHGFGFLVESFARFSGKLPRENTEKGNLAAQAIISELHSGNKGNIRLGSSRSNSDFLWVKLIGRRILITGIGEVKASYLAASQKVGGQLKRQETDLDLLAERLVTAKAEKHAGRFFQKRGIVVSDDLDRFLLMPFGEGEHARGDERFSDWCIVDLEFSYGELVFIAQQIWPDFRPDIKIGPGKLASLDQTAIELSKWIRPRLDVIFSDSEEFGHNNQLPYFELGLFFLATGKTPMLEDEVRWSAELVRNSFWPAVQRCLNFFLNSTPRPEIDFSDKDKALFRKFWYVLTPNRENLEHFIYFNRSLGAQIKSLVRDQGQLEQLSDMSEVWKL